MTKKNEKKRVKIGTQAVGQNRFLKVLVKKIKALDIEGVNLRLPNSPFSCPHLGYCISCHLTHVFVRIEDHGCG